MLILNQIQFKYPTCKILHDVSFSLKKGEIGTIIGPSGSGKTTLFKILTGLIVQDNGNLIINGNEEFDKHQHIACMMQEDLLLPWRTILKNLTLLSELGRKPFYDHHVIAEAKMILEEIGLSNCEDLFPHQLSLGMKQRVSLARALLQKRAILLLDEPFASLDVALREQMYVLLREIQKKNQTTILMVTHDFRDALSLSDHIFFLSEGRIKKKWEVSENLRNDPAKSGIFLNELRQTIISS